MSAATDETVCTHIREMLPAYALGALEPDERSIVDRHLATCPSCRAEAATYAQIVDSLGAAAPQEAPPPGLKGRVLAAALGQPVVAPAVASESVAATPAGAASPWWSNRLVRVLSAASILLLIGVIVLGVLLAQALDERDEAVDARDQLARYFGPGSNAIAMTSLDGSNYGFSQGKGTLLTAPGEPTMVVVGGCPPSSDVRVYRVWTASQGDRTGVGTIEVDDQGNGWMLIDDTDEIGQYDQIGVTMVTNGEQRNDMFVAQVQPAT